MHLRCFNVRYVPQTTGAPADRQGESGLTADRFRRRDGLQGTVLDGSVRRSGNRVRVTVQLVEVASGFQVWSDGTTERWPISSMSRTRNENDDARAATRRPSICDSAFKISSASPSPKKSFPNQR